MYIKTLRLQNIKCFEDTTFSFTTDDGNIAKWVTLLGENATGKTTALQALAYLLGGEKIWGVYLMRQMEIWPRIPHQSGLLSSSFLSSNGVLCDGGFFINKRALSFSEESRFPLDGFSAAYGPFRRLARREALPSPPSKPERYTNFTSLFGEEDGVATFEQWIWSLDNQAAKGDSTARHKLDAALRALTDLLPDGVVFDREALDKRSEVRFLVQNTSIPTYALSDGYRSILALGGDLLWRLLNAYPESDSPTHEEGVVLIDELDIHLHPRWQSWIAQKLRSVFPNIQFIVATHSPLVAMGAYWDGETGERRDDVLTLKLEINDGKASVQRIDDDLAAMDINRALESPAFGMVAPRPPQVEEKIDRYDELLEKEQRTQAEEVELQKLQQFMSDVRPIGGKPVPGSFEAKLEDYLREKLG